MMTANRMPDPSNRAKAVTVLRGAIRVVGAIALCGLFASGPQAQERYPARPITLVVPFAAGGPTDNFSRVVAERLSKDLGQPVVVINRTGAGGIIGTQSVATSKPDGYTLLVGTAATHGINLPLYKSLPYHPLRDFEMVAFLNRQSFVLLTAPSMPRNLKDFIATVKANPQKYAYASAGNGTTSHLYTEILKTLAGIDAVHVPFKGSGPALQSILGGQPQFMLESFGFAKAQIQAGKIQALAVGSRKRSADFPDVPTFTEAGLQGFEPATWSLLAAPAKTPKAIVDQLNAAVNKIMSDRAIVERLDAIGFESVADSTPESATAIVKSEIEKFTKVVNALGIKLD